MCELIPFNWLTTAVENSLKGCWDVAHPKGTAISFLTIVSMLVSDV